MKVLAFIFLMCSCTFVLAQTKPATTKPAATKPAPGNAGKPAPVLKNALDSFSYALGLSMAGFYKEQGVENFNPALVTKALSDVKSGKPLLDENQVNSVIINYMQTVRGAKAENEKKLGRAFIDSIKKQSNVVALPSGLVYQVLQEGTGAKPGPTDKVKVHYEGRLINGKIFDSSIQRGEPLELSVNGVIAGWTEALQLMPTGSKWKLYIPSELGYGDMGAGADIKPGATLVFDVHLLEIVQ